MEQIMEIKIEEESNIIISFAPNDVLHIKTEGDIDLTEFVNRLYLIINEKKTIKVNKAETEDHKLRLIENTIEEIVNVYNECIIEID